jgi:hypothetical protein
MPTKRTTKAPVRRKATASATRRVAKPTRGTKKVTAASSKRTVRKRAPAKPRGEMTVREAGRKGGERVKATRGVAFYSEIGRKGGAKGGPKVRELIERGKRATES